VTSPWALTDARVWGGPESGWSGEAVGFGRDGRIAAVGTLAHVLACLPPGATQMSCGHRLVAPGFVDGHAHVRASAASRLAVDASDVASAAELLSRLDKVARERPAGSWISLANIEPRSFAGPLPSRAEVDRAGGDHPVRARLRSLHGWLLNSQARRIARIAQTEPDLVPDHTGDVADRLGAAASPDEIEREVGRWSAELLGSGVVALTDAGASNGSIDVEQLQGWHRRGVLRQEPATLTASPVDGSAGVKVMPDSGIQLGDRIRRGLALAWSSGLPAAVHCADTETLGELIEAVESIPAGQRGALRIEHASLCPDEWLDRVAALRPMIVTHPGFIHDHGERYLDDPELPFPDWLYRVGSWLARGCRVAFGSDSPAGPADPLLALRAAVTRRTAKGRMLGPDERINAWSALTALTAAPADASRLHGFGRIAPGGPGMVVVLDGDLATPEGVERICVSTVIANGEPVR